jgi:two-component system, chemotaxis family, chemotaxis protein CheY
MKHCLVIDDSDVVRKVARRILESRGLEVTEAADGKRGVEQCVERMPDAVIVDWRMPEMNGLEFLGALRLSTRQPRPYIIYCTTENDPAEISRAYAGGASNYLLKPFDRGSLEEKFAEAGLL